MSGGGGYVEQSEGERMLADLADEQWDDYQARFIPLENAFIGRMENVRNERPLATGRAAATVTQAFDPAYEDVGRTMIQRGAAPGSGAFTAGLADIAAAEGSARGKAVVAADRDTENRYYAGQQQIVNLGRGVATDANIGMRRMAGLGDATARADAQASMTESDAIHGAIGTVAGAAGRKGLEDGWFKREEAA